MPDVEFKNAVFDSFQAAILKMAYVQAIIALGGNANLDQGERSKIAKIVMAIGEKRIAAGGELAASEDAQSVATIASERFLKVSTRLERV